MPIKNPVSIPGSWSKEPSTVGDEDEPSVVGSESTPRSVVLGVVNKSGEIVDDSGKAIGKITDAKDLERLAGNTVTATGDVVNESGDVLGKASLAGEYTTQQADQTVKQADQTAKQAGGWNLIGKTKTAFQTANNLRGPVSNTLQLAGNLRGRAAAAGATDASAAGASGATDAAGVKDVKDTTDAAGVKEVKDATDAAGVKDVKNVSDGATKDAESATTKVVEGAKDATTKDVEGAKNAASKDVEGAKDATAKETKGVESAAKGAQDPTGAKSVADEKSTEHVEDVKELKDKDGSESTVGKTKGAAASASQPDTNTSVADTPGSTPLDEPTAAIQLMDNDKAAAAKEAAGSEKTSSVIGDKLGAEKGAAAADADSDSGVEGLAEAADGSDEPLVVKSPVPIDGEGSERDLKAGSEAADTLADKASDQGTEKAPASVAGAAEGAEEKASELAPSEDAAEEAKDKASELTQSEQAAAEAVEAKTSELAPSEAAADDAAEKASELSPSDAVDGQAGDLASGADGKSLAGADVEAGDAAEGTEKAGSQLDDGLATATEQAEGEDADADADAETLAKEGEEKVLGEGEEKVGEEKEGDEEGAAEGAEGDEEKPTLDYTILEGSKVNKAGNLVDEDGDVVGRLVEGDAKQLKGRTADAEGNILDDSGNKIGRAEPIPKEGEEEPKIDYTILEGSKVNKAGNLVNKDGDVVGRLVEGDAKQLQGRTADGEGNIWNESGKKIGRAEPISDEERKGAKDFAPFENFPDAKVEADGRVVSEGRQVGVVVEGDAKHLKGSQVDEDGDILDRRGNVVGRAEAWDEPEPVAEEEPDRSMLAGKRVNKAGNVVDAAGVIYGRVVEGNVASLVGRMCNKDGQVMSESGEPIGRAELVPEHEREGSKEGPFADLVGCSVTKEGKVVTASGDVVGRLTSGDGKTLFGRSVDEDGDVVDRNGNVLGKAERWEEPEVEKKRNALAGRRVNREGNIVDDDGNIVGKLVSGDVAICAGMEVDDDGDVVNSKGHTIGHVSLLADVPPEEETAEEREAREQAEKDQKLAGQLAAAIEQSLDQIRPICRLITEKVDRAERTPKEELDEEQLVKDVKPLIEQGHRILTETNGTIRGLDPDGRIQRQAKHKAATRDATPEEHHLAELTGTVTETIENAKRKIEDMPHAKKELNPLWGLLSEPLFQILAAVGLLLNGVLGLVGKLLGGLGLGGLVDNLLGSLGLNKVLGSLGLGSALDALTGKKKK
ncbi:hypothetical protein CDD83_1163 [Cordyceps sp. RAO-2017]|nr:hypothetical protein CDD83_1163 [Cordyceps sp. RAO-2017]